MVQWWYKMAEPSKYYDARDLDIFESVNVAKMELLTQELSKLFLDVNIPNKFIEKQYIKTIF